MIYYTVPDLRPGSEKWYNLRWAESEIGVGNTISSVAWTVPAELNELDTQLTGLTAGVKLSAAAEAVLNTHYDVVCEVTTSAPEVRAVTMRLRVSRDGH